MIQKCVKQKGAKQRGRGANDLQGAADQAATETLLPLQPKMLVIPVRLCPLRAAKYDVALRQESLWAVQAVHTMLTRMVLFECKCCRERFPAFHPAYEPPEALDLLKRTKTGLASCDISVHEWDEAPAPPKASEEELLVAAHHTGTCLRCWLDVEKLKAALPSGSGEKHVVPLRNFKNHMDPLFRFPYDRYWHLFLQATEVEELLLALEHMVVHTISIRKSFTKFKKNTIAFEQDLPAFARRLGLLDHFSVGDRVNSVRGPGHDVTRPVRYQRDAQTHELELHAVDEERRLVYPAQVIAVNGDGTLELEYRHGGRGKERVDQVEARVQMPWHPKQMRNKLVIMLRRNIGRGVVIEGIQVRWWLVAQILQALTEMGPYRLDGSIGPMHKYYDPRLFHVMSEEEIMRECAPWERTAKYRPLQKRRSSSRRPASTCAGSGMRERIGGGGGRAGGGRGFVFSVGVDAAV